jgi:hypothetical protein
MATDEAAGPAPSPARRGASKPEKVDNERCVTLLPPIRLVFSLMTFSFADGVNANFAGEGS